MVGFKPAMLPIYDILQVHTSVPGLLKAMICTPSYMRTRYRFGLISRRVITDGDLKPITCEVGNDGIKLFRGCTGCMSVTQQDLYKIPSSYFGNYPTILVLILNIKHWSWSYQFETAPRRKKEGLLWWHHSPSPLHHYLVLYRWTHSKKKTKPKFTRLKPHRGSRKKVYLVSTTVYLPCASVEYWYCLFQYIGTGGPPWSLRFISCWSRDTRSKWHRGGRKKVYLVSTTVYLPCAGIEYWYCMFQYIGEASYPGVDLTHVHWDLYLAGPKK